MKADTFAFLKQEFGIDEKVLKIVEEKDACSEEKAVKERKLGQLANDPLKRTIYGSTVT